MHFPLSNATDASKTPQTLGQILSANGGKLPSKFEDLIKASGGTEENVVLVPRGRSLVAGQTDFANPRILLNAFGGTRETPAKLLIGYTPKSDSLEVMTWNPTKKNYDFLIVRNYSDPSKQVLERAHQGLCTTCHKNGTTLFAPAPWGEVTKAAKRMADALKSKPGYPLYYGVNLDKYTQKGVSFKRAQNFFGSLAGTEASRRKEEICSAICKSGNLAQDLMCQRMILRSSIRRLKANEDPDLQLLIDQEINGLLDPRSGSKKPTAEAEVFRSESKRLSSVQVRANNMLIPERDPDTGKLYRPAVEPHENRAMQERVRAYFKEHPEAAGDPSQIPFGVALIPLTPEETKNSDLKANQPEKAPVSEDEVANVLAVGCYNFNQTQMDALNKAGLDVLLERVAKLEPGSDLLTRWPHDPNELTRALTGSHAKSDSEVSCLDTVSSALTPVADANLTVAKKAAGDLLGKKNEMVAAFTKNCTGCHNGREERVLPYETLIDNGGKTTDAGVAALQKKMIRFLDPDKPKMPPPDSDEVKNLDRALRTKMIQAISGP